MKIQTIYPQYQSLTIFNENKVIKNNKFCCDNPLSKKYNCSFGSGIQFNDQTLIININHDNHSDKFRLFPDISRYSFLHTDEKTLKQHDTICDTFSKCVDINELFDPTNHHIPIHTKQQADEFIKISSIYSQYKNNPIICLGRSPKWFLNANLWMKNGIEDYIFVPFSGYWYRQDPIEGMTRMQHVAPTPEEEKVYHEFLLNKKVDPATIIKHYHDTGKKTIITDYVCSGKGACSFLDILAKLGLKQGVDLKEFVKSINFVKIGCIDYMENIYGYYKGELAYTPEVLLPEDLCDYYKYFEQHFFDMDRDIFDQFLLNQNANECRSTYYPPRTWTKYNPEDVKIGFSHDLNKYIKEIIENERFINKRCAIFTPAMYDYRNATTHRILRYLQANNLLKTTFKHVRI